MCENHWESCFFAHLSERERSRMPTRSKRICCIIIGGSTWGRWGSGKPFSLFATRLGNAHLNTGFEPLKTPSGFSIGKHGVFRAWAEKSHRHFTCTMVHRADVSACLYGKQLDSQNSGASRRIAFRGGGRENIEIYETITISKKA